MAKKFRKKHLKSKRAFKRRFKKVTFSKKVMKVVNRYKSEQFIDVPFAQFNVIAWGLASLTVLTSNQIVDCYGLFLSNVANGYGGNNSLSNKALFTKVVITGNIANSQDNILSNSYTDLVWRESIVQPKDAYWSAAIVETGVAGSSPTFN